MSNTTTMSTTAYLANIYNPILINIKLIKINLENKFITLYGLSHNRHWRFRIVDDDTKLEELTVHNYDTRLKEKCIIHSMKDVILIDLQKNDLHSLSAYIKAIKVITNVLSMK